MATGGKPKKKNPRLASGRKRVRQDVKINAANTSLRSKYRTAVKNVEKAVAAGDKTKASELFAKAQSIVDSVADKGIFHKNKAARDKSRLSAKVKGKWGRLWGAAKAMLTRCMTRGSLRTGSGAASNGVGTDQAAMADSKKARRRARPSDTCFSP